ncbi:MAG: AraC family transcriptional regulator [Clostridiales bacterium]|nr:AraC family transcriptional regulator [Clostridiales bacterium]
MHPFYENAKQELKIEHRRSGHVAPHIHKSLHYILVTKGTLELGVGQELYHMETGDFAVIFPEVIHHYQVFSPPPCKAIYLMAATSLCTGYLTTLQHSCPEYPIIPAGKIHPDIEYAMKRLLSEKNQPDPPDKKTVQTAFVHLILARSLPCFHLVDKDSVGSEDIIYQTVSYMAGHFLEDVSLSDMAQDLGVSPYVLSRVFSGTFHTNFNQYLNDLRLEYASSLLVNTDSPITDICLDAGFQSQRTFNRAFKERYHMSPSEYRKQ